MGQRAERGVDLKGEREERENRVTESRANDEKGKKEGT